MHRQSLGSPSSKLAKADEQLSCEAQKQFPSQSPSSSAEARDEDAKKMMKIRAPNFDNKPQTYIHLIPMLTLLCFLVLYLVSHDPSQNELRVVKEVEKGDTVAIRSLKNLETEAGTARHRLLHRKIAHF
ncbi:N-acetylneuraminate epimerase [Striga asiatica]|uniref:N-acetylneuraminate epimerase n=1 Tax=Striga asiatica TaxID=4170 RepID=A0A5A7PS17_STRAF|nr:N-acetylneuraminate epimerase [Striga asiatica]